MPDNYSEWEAHERERERRLANCLVCAYCEQAIQDDKAFHINDKFYHVGCAEHEFEVWTEDYIV